MIARNPNPTKKARSWLRMGFCNSLIIIFFLQVGLFADWVQDQIHEDLAAFSESGIKRSAVQLTAEQLLNTSQSILVKIDNNQLSFQTSSVPFDPNREKAVRHFLEILSEHFALPDIEFVISLEDTLDHTEDFIAPVFVFAKNRSAYKNVLIPDFEVMVKNDKLISECHKAAKQHLWESKKDKIFWRGSTSGGINGVYQMTLDTYKDFPRVKLVSMGKNYPAWLDVGFTTLCQSSPEVLETVLKTSRPLCRIVSIKDHFAYKYLIDIDGNSCTYSRCRWILLSNSALLKPASSNIQWYYKALRPYEHYVPIKEDLSDLPDMYQWLKTHNHVAHSIARQGRRLGKILFTQSAIEEYFLTLLNEYAKIYKKSE